MEHKERFRWGWCPTTGKKGDLMFAQHMLAVCREDGMVATVMPHGVLFRGGAEREIRRKWLQEDLIESVIGLPQNLFYGASIPACVIVMRPNRSGLAANPNKPEARRQRVLFINADAEFFAGRAQNYLRPEHDEKIVSTYERFEGVPAYGLVVPVAELLSEANDANLNIRRYVDNSPAPEPHDVRAHLLGGVPVREIEARRALFAALGFDPARAFTPRAGDDRYRDFAPVLTDRAAIRILVETDPGVLARAAALREALAAWWSEHSVRLVELPARRQLNAVRTDLLRSFNTALTPVGVLDHYKLAGVIATWWTETLPDLKTLMENGFAGVIDGWVDAIADALEDEDSAGATIDPFTHKLVRRVMLDYLDQIDAAKADIARFKGEKETWRELPLKSVAEARFSNVDKLSTPGEEPVRLCNYTDVYQNDYITGELSFMRATATHQEIRRFGLQLGDVIITKDSETPDDIGIPSVVDYTAPDMVCGYHLALIRPNKDALNATFLAKQLSHERLARYFCQ